MKNAQDLDIVRNRSDAQNAKNKGLVLQANQEAKTIENISREIRKQIPEVPPRIGQSKTSVPQPGQVLSDVSPNKPSLMGSGFPIVFITEMFQGSWRIFTFSGFSYTFGFCILVTIMTNAAFAYLISGFTKITFHGCYPSVCFLHFVV